MLCINVASRWWLVVVIILLESFLLAPRSNNICIAEVSVFPCHFVPDPRTKGLLRFALRTASANTPCNFWFHCTLGVTIRKCLFHYSFLTVRFLFLTWLTIFTITGVTVYDNFTCTRFSVHYWSCCIMPWIFHSASSRLAHNFIAPSFWYPFEVFCLLCIANTIVSSYYSRYMLKNYAGTQFV